MERAMSYGSPIAVVRIAVVRIVSHAILFCALFAILVMLMATSPFSEAKSVPSEKRNPVPTKTVSSKTTSTSKSRLFASTDHDLLARLEANQRDLSRRLETLTGTTERGVSELSRGVDTLTGQEQQSHYMQQQNLETQQSLAAMIHSMHVLLILTVGLQLVLCGAVFFLGFQAKKTRPSAPPKERDQIDHGLRERADTKLEPQWKTGQ